MACFLQGIAQSNASWRDWDYEKQARHLVLAMFSTYRWIICSSYDLCISRKTHYTFTVMKWIYYLVVLLVFILMNWIVDAIFGCWWLNVLLIIAQVIAFMGTLLITNQKSL